MTNREENERRLDYAFVVGKFLSEGFSRDETTIKRALRLNPESPIEKAMRAKSEKELQKVGQEIIEAQNAFEEGYSEGAPKRKDLTQTENEEFARYGRLLRSNDPTSMNIGKTELEAFCAKKIAEGVCPDVLRKKIREELE